MTKAQLEQLKSELVQVNGTAEPRQSLTRRDVVSVFFATGGWHCGPFWVR